MSIEKVKPATVQCVSQFEDDAGEGFEGADKDSYAIPFLQVLQGLSPCVDEESDQYIKDAKPGMLFITGLDEIFDGRKGISIIPVHYEHKYTEWVPRDKGGGFRGEHLPEDIDITSLERDPSGRYVTADGNYLSDTRRHFCLVVDPVEFPRPVVLCLSSTQIKKSRNWMSVMNSIKIDGKKGKFTPPAYSHIYHLSTVDESNEKGKWKGVKITIERRLGDTDEDATLYFLAKSFRKQVISGEAIIEEEAATKNDDVLF